jgi:hypothetical protein
MDNQPLIKLNEKRDIGQVLNATFAFLRISYKYMYKDMLIMVAPFFVISGVINAFVTYDVFSVSLLERLNRPSMYSSPFYYLGLLCSAIGWTFAYTIVGNYIYQYKITGSAEFDVPAIREASRKDFSRILVAFIIFYLSIIGGAILLIIPGIYFAVANSAGIINMVLNKEAKVGSTFGESRRLINDNWWRTFGLGFITLLIVSGITMVFSIPTSIYSFLIAFHSTSGAPEEYQLPFIIFAAFARLAYCLAAPISIIASAIYYYSLKEEKDQVSLLEKIDAMGTKSNETKVNEGSY